VDSSSKPAPFSFATVEAFDAHIGQSIPGFAHLVDMVVGLAGYHLDRGARVLDLGCSTGALLLRLNTQYLGLELDLVGYDCERNLLGAAVNQHLIEHPLYALPNIHFELENLVEPCILDLDIKEAALVTSIFTLQFLPEGRRLPLLERVYQALRPGGALIVAEKIHQPSGQLQERFGFVGYDFKQRAFTPAQILSKEQDLRHLMRPLSEAENVVNFRQAGFTSVTPFWQGLNFKAWLCIK
jgi:tRNA (cmo5U34)-methyltransferase